MTAAAELAVSLPRGRTITVDTTRYAEAGATDAQQLGWAMATGVDYLRAFEQAGIGPAEAAATICFRMAVGADQFAAIAVLRAARRLWARVLEQCGVAAGDRATEIQAVTVGPRTAAGTPG
ncbi:MAG: methylmalonyl-CoA mutase family protein [Acidimicrobiales bacterium]